MKNKRAKQILLSVVALCFVIVIWNGIGSRVFGQNNNGGNGQPSNDPCTTTNGQTCSQFGTGDQCNANYSIPAPFDCSEVVSSPSPDDSCVSGNSGSKCQMCTNGWCIKVEYGKMYYFGADLICGSLGSPVGVGSRSYCQ